MKTCLLIALLCFVAASASAENIIEISALKLHQPSRSHAGGDFKLVNKTRNDLKSVAVKIEIFDAKGRYLGLGEGFVQFLRAGNERTFEVIFLDTQVRQIKQWSAQFDGVVGMSGLREDFKYKLVQK